MKSDPTRQRLRAWDSINREMHYDFQYMWVSSKDEDEAASGIIWSSDLHIHNFEKWPPDDDNYTNKKLHIMEWLHAVDQLAIPIYEGDLVKVETFDKEWLGFARWGSKGCAVCWNTFEVSEGKFHDYCFFDQADTKFTVVGNIYQNKEMVSHLYDLKILSDD